VSLTAQVDNAAPATGNDVPAEWGTEDVTVTLTADDGAGSGVAATWYTLDGSNPADAANPSRRRYDPAAKPTLSSGRRITYASVDALGNAEAPRTSFAAKVDKAAPATSDDVPASVTTTPVAVTLTPTDTGGSGVATTWYTTDGSDPAVAANPARREYSSAARPALGAGQRIRYYSVDAVGNAEAGRMSRTVTVAGGTTTPAPSQPATTTAPPASPAPPEAPAAASALVPAATAAPTTTSKTTPTAPALGAVKVASVLRAATVKAKGVAVTLKVPAAAKVVQLQVLRAGRAGARAAAASRAKPLATIYRFPKRAGTFRTALNSAKLRRLLKPGTYELRARAGATKAKIGTPTVQRFRIRP
jgi:hypothetical protein